MGTWLRVASVVFLSAWALACAPRAPSVTPAARRASPEPAQGHHDGEDMSRAHTLAPQVQVPCLQQFGPSVGFSRQRDCRKQCLLALVMFVLLTLTIGCTPEEIEPPAPIPETSCIDQGLIHIVVGISAWNPDGRGEEGRDLRTLLDQIEAFAAKEGRTNRKLVQVYALKFGQISEKPIELDQSCVPPDPVPRLRQPPEYQQAVNQAKARISEAERRRSEFRKEVSDKMWPTEAPSIWTFLNSVEKEFRTHALQGERENTLSCTDVSQGSVNRFVFIIAPDESPEDVLQHPNWRPVDLKCSTVYWLQFRFRHKDRREQDWSCWLAHAWAGRVYHYDATASLPNSFFKNESVPTWNTEEMRAKYNCKWQTGGA